MSERFYHEATSRSVNDVVEDGDDDVNVDVAADDDSARVKVVVLSLL